ncbi:methyltransferase-like protein 5-like protein [Paraphysoderma sedebokerense]|nr:methyltransferase-like protein 5-like protein [Paraphysoderma sedebokerense]
MKLRQLEEILEEVEVFSEPKIQYEQYPTTPHLAARMLFTAHSTFDDIEGKCIVDLGIGCGVLTIGSAVLGAGYNIGFDIDMDAISVAEQNLADFEIEADIVLCDVENIQTAKLQADTVFMNPPFGTKVKGIDMIFLKKATEIADVVYSLHKTSTREYIVKKAQEWGFKCEVLAQLRYDLKNTYKFHKKKSVDIEVDFIRLARKS